LVKLSVKELVLAGAWRVQRGEHKRMLIGPKTAHALVPGANAVPGRPPLPAVNEALLELPAKRRGLVEGRVVRAVAKHFAARQLDDLVALRDTLLAALERDGLVERRAHAPRPLSTRQRGRALLRASRRSTRS
jgi:hypothetical protein